MQYSLFNIHRKMFHMFGLVIPVMFFLNIYDYFNFNLFREDTRSLMFYMLSFLCLILIVIEILRFNFSWARDMFIQVAGGMLKKEELHKINGSIPFFLANTILVGFFSREIAVLSMLFLLVGDTCAAYFGSKYGRNRIWNQKSIEGALGGTVGSILAGIVFLIYITLFDASNKDLKLWDHSGIKITSWVILITGSLAAFSIEIISSYGLLDDNLTLPVGSAILMSVLLALTRDMPIWFYFYPIEQLLIPL